MSDTAVQSLVGGDFAAVCARFGAPLSCRHEAGVLRLTYADDSGQPVDGAVQMVDGVVTAVADSICRSPRECCGQALIGRPVELVLPALGQPLAVEQLGESTRYVYADREVTAHEGTVACVVPRALQQ